MDSVLIERLRTALADVRPSDETAWHAWRAGGIGASECAAALGLSPYMSPYKLYQIKTGAIQPDKPTPAMLLGLDLEPAVLASYSRRTNRRIIERGICVQHPKYPWLRATLDAIDIEGNNVEAKTTRWSKAGEWGPDGDASGIPLHVISQVQHQSLIVGGDGAVAVLIGGEDFRAYDVPFNARIGDHIIERLAEFWECVQSRTPPKMGEDDERIAALLAPTTAVPASLGDSEAEMADLYEMNKRAAKAFGDAAEAARDRLIYSLGGSSIGVLPDGRQILRNKVEVKGYSVEPRTDYRFQVVTPKGGR